MPEYIRVSWSERSCILNLCRVVYSMHRLLYVIFWFYFLPYLAILFAFFYSHNNERFEELANEIEKINLD